MESVRHALLGAGRREFESRFYYTSRSGLRQSPGILVAPVLHIDLTISYVNVLPIVILEKSREDI